MKAERLNESRERIHIYVNEPAQPSTESDPRQHPVLPLADHPRAAAARPETDPICFYNST